MPRLTRHKESATRKKVDIILKNIGWQTDEESPDCNVFTERCKLQEQTALLHGKEPDYVLYKSGTDLPLAIIETKRPGQTLTAALTKAINDYATPLEIYIIFTSDGAITEVYDRRSNGPLRLDGEIITDFLTEKQLLRFVAEGSDLVTPQRAILSKQELIRIFAEANALLRKEGLREGIERFTEFSNLIFLKLISEIEEDRERHGERRILNQRYCWEQFCNKDASDMLDYINDSILPRLVDKYNHSGDVFQKKLLITNPQTLKKIVDKLTPLILLDVDSDIKGDAFEYFLKNSITVGNDLGEYFTPRHIVKLIVDLIDPRFGEKLYDPCCGTGGFLIESFRHIKTKVTQTKRNLYVLKNKTVFGRELTGTAKIAKMNMILTDDGHTNIVQIDSLQHPINEEYDIVVTNYPFSQKTDYSSYYGIDTEDANPVFLKHVINALKKDGRAGIVVPEGLLFDEKTQYVNTRHLLIDQCNLIAVIKLDSYVFRPYTGQPTSILIFNKDFPTKKVWFFDVKQDGFQKTASKIGRRPIKENDLLLLRQIWNEKDDSERSFSIDADIIRQHKYKLNINEYTEKAGGANWVKLGGEGGVCDIKIGGTQRTSNAACWNGNYLWAKISDMNQGYIVDTEKKITEYGIVHSTVKLLPKGTVLLSFKLSIGKVAIAGTDLYTNEAIAGIIPKDEGVLPKYLFYILSGIDLMSYAQPAAKGTTLNKALLESILIPLPSKEMQLEIIEIMDQKESARRQHLEEVAQLEKERNEIIKEYLNRK